MSDALYLVWFASDTHRDEITVLGVYESESAAVTMARLCAVRPVMVYAIPVDLARTVTIEAF